MAASRNRACPERMLYAATTPIPMVIIRSKAIKLANSTLSPTGVHQTLLSRLAINENFRHNIFKGRFHEKFSEDPIQATEERIRGKYLAGLM